MCTYCMIGDTFFRYDPPWPIHRRDIDPWRYIPTPISPAPVESWPLEKLRDYLDLLERVKKLEDQLGCPCEPNKADYIGLFKERIAKLEEAVKDRPVAP